MGEVKGEDYVYTGDVIEVGDNFGLEMMNGNGNIKAGDKLFNSSGKALEYVMDELKLPLNWEYEETWETGTIKQHPDKTPDERFDALIKQGLDMYKNGAIQAHWDDDTDEFIAHDFIEIIVEHYARYMAKDFRCEYSIVEKNLYPIEMLIIDFINKDTGKVVKHYEQRINVVG